jgi:hypothetical protein
MAFLFTAQIVNYLTIKNLNKLLQPFIKRLYSVTGQLSDFFKKNLEVLML